MDSSIAENVRGRILVLTGAGISVASGIAPFRGDGGLYEGLNPYDLATPQAFAKHPVTVWNWYLMRIHQGLQAKPNRAHHALAELATLVEELEIVTSNVDELHEIAGSKKVYHLHGKILETRCIGCGDVRPLDTERLPEKIDAATILRCHCGAMLRPNVVWFGEYPWDQAMNAAELGLRYADAILEVGSSGIVSYGFAEHAVTRGKFVLRINPEPEPHPGISLWSERAEVALPRLVEWLRASHSPKI